MNHIEIDSTKLKRSSITMISAMRSKFCIAKISFSQPLDICNQINVLHTSALDVLYHLLFSQRYMLFRLFHYWIALEWPPSFFFCTFKFADPNDIFLFFLKWMLTNLIYDGPFCGISFQVSDQYAKIVRLGWTILSILMWCAFQVAETLFWFWTYTN